MVIIAFFGFPVRMPDPEVLLSGCPLRPSDALTRMAGHYENFPVGSLLLPRRLREPVAAIYWFARSADDIADEGALDPATRLALLGDYREHLARIARGTPAIAGPDRERWEWLAETIRRHDLPSQLFHDLLDAFAQDVVKKRYATFAELQDYCRRSANPVGRLLLCLFGNSDEAALRESDAICTALQLLNFCQDVAIDWQKDRIYFPADEIRTISVGESHFARGIVDPAWQRLFALQLDRAVSLLRSGAGLPDRLHGRVRLELRAIIAGGERIGERLRATGGDVFNRRPVLRTIDWLLIALRVARLAPGPAGARAFQATAT